jgi:uncharacterized protein YndB with AHSA1/START domain
MSSTATKTQLPSIVANTYINAPVEKVFTCLTTASGWNSWFTTESILEPKIGGKIKFVWRNWGVNHVNHEDGGEIFEFELNKQFVFTWHTSTTPTKVTFTLEPRGKGTILTVCDAGYAFEELEKFCGFLDCSVGWGEAITLLKMYLEHGVQYGLVPKK